MEDQKYLTRGGIVFRIIGDHVSDVEAEKNVITCTESEFGEMEQWEYITNTNYRKRFCGSSEKVDLTRDDAILFFRNALLFWQREYEKQTTGIDFDKPLSSVLEYQIRKIHIETNILYKKVQDVKDITMEDIDLKSYLHTLAEPEDDEIELFDDYEIG